MTQSYSGSNQDFDVKRLVIVIFLLVMTLLYYTVGPVKFIIDVPVNFVVRGATWSYSNLSNFLYDTLGLNIGFVHRKSDADFDFRVMVATYVKNRQASGLLHLASDPTFTQSQREEALLSLLKFESISDWIQPFLNELPKGSLPGLYDPDAPALNKVMERIRLEGGIRQPLVRAYGETVISFLAQHPNNNMRRHALQWVSDVIPEEAIFILTTRLKMETEPALKRDVLDSLWELRAVSEPKEAQTELFPLYQKNRWPEAQQAMVYVLARIGYQKGQDFIANLLDSKNLSEDRRMKLLKARRQEPFPRTVVPSPEYMAQAKEQRLVRARQIEEILARKYQVAEESPIQVAQLPEVTETKPVAAKNAHSQKSDQSIDDILRDLDATEKEGQASKSNPSNGSEGENASEESKTTSEVEEQPVERSKPKEPKKSSSGKSADRVEVAQLPLPPAHPVVPPVLPPTSKPPVQKPPLEKPPVEKSVPTPIQKPPVENPPVEAESPVPAPVEKPAKPVFKKADVVFEVRDQDIPLYTEPDSHDLNGTILPIGTKGKAIQMAMLGEQEWFNVQTKKGSGWAMGDLLTKYDLSPQSDTTEGSKKAVPGAPDRTSREEATYFEAATESVPTYQIPSEGTPTGVLEQGKAYLAKESQKVGPDRWFLLEIAKGKQGWVRGIDVQLANVEQPAQEFDSNNAFSQKKKKSAFAPEWVKATVKGVGVFGEASFVSKRLLLINPTDVYKVLDSSEGNGEEWYKIELANKKEGWVQAMDVSLTKAPQQ